MYDEARRGIKKHLIKITQGPKKLIHTVEMAPRKHTKVWVTVDCVKLCFYLINCYQSPGYRMYSKQDHLVSLLTNR